MQQFTIHIPQQFNDGRDIPQQAIDDFLELALDKFGGYTINPLPVLGAWRDPDTGTVYKEPMLQMHIASESDNKVTDYVAQIGGAFKQECMYMVKSGQVEFVS